MTLLELTEPLFQYICRLNRVARKSATIEYETVRSEVRELFVTMKDQSVSEHRLAEQYQLVELPLIFFTDATISESRLHFAMEWNQNRMAFERQELAGDERFFELLDETLHQHGEEASERLAVFYTCLGLGFSGWYSGQPEVLKRKMVELAPRIRAFVESDESARICGSCYEHTDTSNLPLPVATRLIGIAIIFIGVLFVVGAANVYLFREASSDLFKALDQVKQNDPAADSSQR